MIRASTTPSYAPTLNGVALSSLGSSPAGTSGYWLHAFYMLQASIPAAGSRTLDVVETGGTGLLSRLVGWAFADNVAQSAPTLTKVQDLSSPTTISIGSFSESAGGIAIAAVYGGVAAVSYTESAGWTEIWDADGSAADSHGAAAYRVYAASGSDTVVFTPVSAPPIAQGMVLYMDPLTAIVLTGSLGQFDPEMRILGWF